MIKDKFIRYRYQRVSKTNGVQKHCVITQSKDFGQYLTYKEIKHKKISDYIYHVVDRFGNYEDEYYEVIEKEELIG